MQENDSSCIYLSEFLNEVNTSDTYKGFEVMIRANDHGDFALTKENFLTTLMQNIKDRFPKMHLLTAMQVRTAAKL